MVQPGLVEEDETIRRNAFYLSEESGALFDNIRPQTLQRPAAFFFTT